MFWDAPVTMFQPMRPPVRWSRVAKRRAVHGVVEAGGGGDDEAEPLGEVGEGGDDQCRVEGREVDATAHREVGQVAVDGREAVPVGEEEEVEPGLVEYLRDVDPVVQFVEAQRVAPRVRPAQGATDLRSGDFEDAQVHLLHGGVPSLSGPV